MSNNIILLLDYFTDDLYVSICKSLNLELYIEDTTTTISGNKFVIDIVKNNNKENVFLYFLEENYHKFFEHIKIYFEICLTKKNTQLFYYLLRFLSKMDNTKSKSDSCKIVKKEYFDICECVFASNSEIEPIDEVVKRGNGYNIFTHRFETLFVHNNIIFHFCLLKNEIFFCNTNIKEYIKNDEINSEEAIKEEITKNFEFYKNTNTEYRLTDKYINIDDKYFIDKDLTVYNTNDEKISHYTFLLQKKFTMQQILDIYEEK